MEIASAGVAEVRSKALASRHSSYDSYGDLRTRSKARRLYEAVGILLSVCGLTILFAVFRKILSD